MKKLLRVLSGESISPPPFWFMRQAGRYMPEYRALRAEAGSFLDLCFNSDYATEVTMQPIRKFKMDAAILFADILLVPMALGVDLKFTNGEGPQLGGFRIEDLVYREEKLQPVFQTVRNLAANFKDTDTTLIGFAGSPWTVATYMIEGGGSKTFAKVKTKALTEPAEFAALIDILVEATISYLSRQIEAGAEVIQLFDSWAGELAGDEFRKWVIEPNAKITAALKSKYPHIKIIGFPRRSNFMLKEFVDKTGVDAISIDNSVPLEWAFENLNCVIQGNLDQITLLADKSVIKAEAERILKATQGKRFIFNLGHGIVQQTPEENVAYLCDVIRQ